MIPIWRALADGLIAAAEALPPRSEGAGHLRDAAASLLDADQALEREAAPTPTAAVRAA